MNPTLPNRKHECQSSMGNVGFLNFIFESLGLYSSLITKSSSSQAGAGFLDLVVLEVIYLLHGAESFLRS